MLVHARKVIGQLRLTALVVSIDICRNGEAHLQRSLGLLPLMMLGVGGMVGTGIFFVLSEAVLHCGRRGRLVGSM